jgi:hypothetical protein
MLFVDSPIEPVEVRLAQLMAIQPPVQFILHLANSGAIFPFPIHVFFDLSIAEGVGQRLSKPGILPPHVLQIASTETVV